MEANLEIIDFRVRLRTRQLLKPWDVNNPAPYFEQYILLYKMAPRLTEMPMDQFVSNMTSQGVSKGVVCGGSKEDNHHLIEIKNTEIGRYFYFVAGIHPDYGIRNNLEELEKCRKEGFLGVNISPYIWGIEANSRQLYPIYAYCETYNMITIVHGSIHFNRHQSMWLGDPKYIDEIAIDFPLLKLVISHAGSGFGVLGLAIAQKNPNVYLEFSALWPKYVPEVTLKAVNSYLREKCLFGTDYPLVDFRPALEAWHEAVKPEVREFFFQKNAERCLFGEPIL